MQLGFVSAILPELNCNEVLTIASELDFDCVEMMCWPPGKATRRYAGVTHIDVAHLTEQIIDEVNNLTWRHGVTISGLGYYGNPLSPDAEEAEQAQQQIRHLIVAGAKLGIPRINTFVGRDWTANVDQNLERFVPVWEPIVQFAEEHDVLIGIENCPMLFTNDEWPGGKNLASSPAIWRRMFELIPSNHFGLNYDPSHMVLQHMDEVAPIREFASRIFHVHAKDMWIDRKALNDVGTFALPNLYSHGRLPGRGSVRWDEFFSALNEVGYNGPVCVEVEDREFEGTLEGRREALRQSAEFLRKFIPSA